MTPNTQPRRHPIKIVCNLLLFKKLIKILSRIIVTDYVLAPPDLWPVCQNGSHEATDAKTREFLHR